ncbi:hypothetical protein FRB99_004151 [Tulasnella sp. 403]|nr:hypothetical protein FRB99_004151 [Tulasnella sp. 403]
MSDTTQIPGVTTEPDTNQVWLSNGSGMTLSNILPSQFVKSWRHWQLNASLHRCYINTVTCPLTKSRLSPSTSRALQIPELVDMICGYASKNDLKTILLVNREFCEVAADHLWRVLKNAKPLLHLWSTLTHRPPPRWISSIPLFNFSQRREPTNEERFNFYARRVKVIQFASFCWEFYGYDKHQLVRVLPIPQNPPILCPSLSSVAVRMHVWHVELFSRFASERLAYVCLTISPRYDGAGHQRRDFSDEELYQSSLLLVRTLGRLHCLRRLSLDWADCPFECGKDCDLFVEIITGNQGLCNLNLPQEPECLCLLKAVGMLPNLSIFTLSEWRIPPPKLQDSPFAGNFPSLRCLNAPINVASSITSLSPAPQLATIKCYTPPLRLSDPPLDSPALTTNLLSTAASFSITTLQIAIDEPLTDTPYIRLLAMFVNMEVFYLSSPTALSDEAILTLVPKWIRLRKLEWRSRGVRPTASIHALSAFSGNHEITTLAIPIDITCETNHQDIHLTLGLPPQLTVLDISQWIICPKPCPWIIRVLRRLVPPNVPAEELIRLGIDQSDLAWWWKVFDMVNSARRGGRYDSVDEDSPYDADQEDNDDKGRD